MNTAERPLLDQMTRTSRKLLQTKINKQNPLEIFMTLVLPHRRLTHFVIMSLCLLLSFGTVVKVADTTEIPVEKGKDVVEGVVKSIKNAGIFPVKDNDILRHIACVESSDGMADNYKDGIGGIWQVDETAFLKTQKPDSFPPGFYEILTAKINQSFKITWADVKWKGLMKPLHSGIAASLLLMLIPGPIPEDLKLQAKYWKAYYNTKGKPQYFIDHAKSCDPISRSPSSLSPTPKPKPIQFPTQNPSVTPSSLPSQFAPSRSLMPPQHGMPVGFSLGPTSGPTSPSTALPTNPQEEDKTKIPGEKGKEVVETVVNRINNAKYKDKKVFADDFHLLRRIAYVESKDGTDPNTYRDGYCGGIWQVDKIAFDETQKPGSHAGLKDKYEAIKAAFGIEWPTVT